MSFHRPWAYKHTDHSSGHTCPVLLRYHRQSNRTPGNLLGSWHSSSSTMVCIHYKFVLPLGSCTDRALLQALNHILRIGWQLPRDRNYTPHKLGSCKSPPCICYSSFRQSYCYRNTVRRCYRRFPRHRAGHSYKASTLGTGNSQHCRGYTDGQRNWLCSDICHWHRKQRRHFRSGNSCRVDNPGSCSIQRYTGHNVGHRILHGISTCQSLGHRPRQGCP